MSLRISPAVRTGSPFLYLGFNQDANCFAVGTSQGFRVFISEPFDEHFGRIFPSGGIGIVEMLYRTNILALVGGGAIPAFPPNQVVFWDDHAVAPVGQLTFPEVVLAVKLRRDRIVVATKNMVYIYNFENFDLVAKHPTADNVFGVVSLSSAPSHCVLATLARQTGYARVENYTAKKSVVFKAHESAIRFMALSPDGSLLATCSQKGTIIRIYDTTGDCAAPLHELRRGTNAAEIYCIAFSHDASMLCAYSDKGTLHLFVNPARASAAAAAAATSATHHTSYSSASSSSGSSSSSMSSTMDDHPEPANNQRSRLSFASSFLPKYFSSEWSFAHWKGPEVPAVCAFGGKPNSVVLITCEGEYYEVLYDAAKGTLVQGAFHRFRDQKAAQ